MGVQLYARHEIIVKSTASVILDERWGGLGSESGQNKGMAQGFLYKLSGLG